MDKGLLNEDLLSKNIEYIEIYSVEEKQELKKICNILEKSCDCYNSDNYTLFSEKIDSIKNNIKLIRQKRKKYETTLSKAIELYNSLVNETKKMFEEAGDSND